MAKSINVLSIDEINITPVKSMKPNIIHRGFEAELVFELKYMCPETGGEMSGIKFKSLGYGAGEQTAMLKAIERFMNGDFADRKPWFSSFISDTNIQRETIDHLEINLPEPFYSMFADLFRESNWKTIKMLS